MTDFPDDVCTADFSTMKNVTKKNMHVYVMCDTSLTPFRSTPQHDLYQVLSHRAHVVILIS